MNRTRRCLYNAIRDRAAADGMARFTSWDDLADTCQIMPRQAQEITGVLDKNALLVRCGNPGEKCFVPLDPDVARREAFFAALYETQFAIVTAARVAHLRAVGVDLYDICEVLETGCADIMVFDKALRRHGFFGR